MDLRELSDQFYDHLPIASEMAKQHNLDPSSAWLQAVHRTQTSRLRDAHPITALGQVLVHKAAFTVSTSGIEQGFAKTMWCFNIYQKSSLPESERDICKIVLDRHPKEEDRVLRHAQQVWAQLYGEARASPKQPRLDKGRKKETSFGKSTEASWLRRRRQAVKLASKGSADTGANQMLKELIKADLPCA